MNQPSRVLKKSFSCFDRLGTNGKSPTVAMPAPFALSLSKGERRVFQHPARANCQWVYQKLDSRFRGNDSALKLFSVLPALRLRSGQAPAGIQGLLLLRINANESALSRVLLMINRLALRQILMKIFLR